MSNEMTCIYALTIDWEQWYIGKSNNPEKRLERHLLDAFSPERRSYSSRKAQWIRSLPDPEEIQLIILEICAKTIWQEVEKEWIAIYREDFGEENVMNSDSGGGGPIEQSLAISQDTLDYILQSRQSPNQIGKELSLDPKYIRHIKRAHGQYNEGTQQWGGENNGSSKLNWKKVQWIRENCRIFQGKELALLFDVSRATITLILQNKTWYDENWNPKLRAYIN